MIGIGERGEGGRERMEEGEGGREEGKRGKKFKSVSYLVCVQWGICART